MAMIRPDHIISAWKTLWDADASLPTLVPGGLWTPPVTGGTTSPYATLTLKAAPPQWVTSGAYLQDWTVEVKVWSTAGAVDAGGIQAALDAAFKLTSKDSLSIPSATRVVSLLAVPGSFADRDGRKERKEALLTTARWTLKLQGQR